MNELTWVEIDREALRENIRAFRGLIGKDRILCPCVKANAYGHGLVEAGKTFLDAGADWLSVNSLYEARALRAAGVEAPIYVLGYIPVEGLDEAVSLDLRMVVYNRETVDALGENGRKAKVHIKAETGNNRQGVFPEDLLSFANYIRRHENIEIEGISTHFANIEDTTDHAYADTQIERFDKAVKTLEDAGIYIPIKHCANSAATILFPKTHFQMVRPGIATYGMWPSNETYVSYLKERGEGFELKPAFTWKARIAQVKTVPSGEYIGYGCTFKTTHDTRLAIIPVGYYDGYDRGISGGHVLIHGKRAPIRGRICMNIIMVDVTDIEEAKLEDEVVLMGRDDGGAHGGAHGGSDPREEISAEQFATWAGTINYEVTTRVNERIPRILV